MNPSLHQLYSRWREIALQENQAIKGGSWDQLNVFADEKQQLMEGIREAELRREPGGDSLQAAISLLIHEVADLEQRNAELLGVELARFESQLKDFRKRRRRSLQLLKNYLKPDAPGTRTHQAEA